MNIIEEHKKRITEVGKTFDQSYQITQQESVIVEDIIGYLTQEKTSLVREKGLMIMGDYGCGKTIMMRILQKIWSGHVDNGFQFHTAQQIEEFYAKDGDNAITKYKTLQKDIFFDDLGTDDVVSHYGNAKDVMENVLLARYSLWQARGYRTHVTTNLNSDQLRERYGERLFSRIPEMFNVITWPQNKSRRFKAAPAPKNIKQGKDTIKQNKMNDDEKTRIYESTKQLLWDKPCDVYLKTGKIEFQDMSLHAMFKALWNLGHIKHMAADKETIERYKKESFQIVHKGTFNRTGFAVDKVSKELIDKALPSTESKVAIMASKLILWDYLQELKAKYSVAVISAAQEA